VLQAPVGFEVVALQFVYPSFAPAGPVHLEGRTLLDTKKIHILNIEKVIVLAYILLKVGLINRKLLQIGKQMLSHF
jgi:hypothetical protein